MFLSTHSDPSPTLISSRAHFLIGTLVTPLPYGFLLWSSTLKPSNKPILINLFQFLTFAGFHWVISFCLRISMKGYKDSQKSSTVSVVGSAQDFASGHRKLESTDSIKNFFDLHATFYDKTCFDLVIRFFLEKRFLIYFEKFKWGHHYLLSSTLPHT